MAAALEGEDFGVVDDAVGHRGGDDWVVEDVVQRAKETNAWYSVRAIFVLACVASFLPLDS